MENPYPKMRGKTKEELQDIIQKILIEGEFKRLAKHFETVHIFNQEGECVNNKVLLIAKKMCLKTGCSSKEAIE